MGADANSLAAVLLRLGALRAYLRGWLGRHEAARQAEPCLRQNLELVEWEMAALGSLPVGARPVPPDLADMLGRYCDSLDRLLTTLPEYSWRDVFCAMRN